MADWHEYEETMHRGRIHRFRFTVTVNGVAQNISTWQKFWATGKRHFSDADPGLFQVTSGAGISIVDGVNGIGQVEIPTTATSGLVNRKHIFWVDVQGRDNNGVVWTLARVKVTVLPTVTLSTS